MPRPVIIAPTPLNVCACVITYRPDRAFPKHFMHLMKTLPKWLIIDNRSSDEDRRRLRDLAGESVELVENDQNLGVAVALNQAARRAQALGFEWLLTFDQDSQPAPDLLAGLIDAYARAPAAETIGMIGSNFIMEGTGLPFYPSKPGAVILELPAIITSGSLLSLRAFAEVGPFRDEFFIDGVDSEFCLRLRGQGFKVAATCAPLMRHSLGELRIHPFLWKRPRISHHSPLRRYYMTRNALVIARKYWLVERAWVILSLKAVAVGFIGAMLFEKHKLKKFGATILGIVHAMRGRMGRVDVRWLNR